MISEHQIADRAIAHLKDGTGFSLIRLGDGEGRLLAYPDEIDREMLDRHLMYWFGRSDFSDYALMAMQATLVAAMGQVDVIGLCPPGRDVWAGVAREYVQKMGRMLPDQVCNASIHRGLWAHGELDRIIEASQRIVVVTCRDVCHPLQERHSRDVLWVAVPEEGHTGEQPTNHWQRFAQIEAEIAKCAAPGVLVLVGAGVLGKAYTTTAAYRGAVALDIGSVFDGWASVGSRSYLRGRLGRYAL